MSALLEEIRAGLAIGTAFNLLEGHRDQQVSGRIAGEKIFAPVGLPLFLPDDKPRRIDLDRPGLARERNA